MKENKNRRQFLRNSALSFLGLSLLPTNLKATQKKTKDRLLNCDQTTQDYYGEGPFYTMNPPNIANNQLAPTNEPGTKMIISGRVFNLDCSQVIPNTVIDVWHADDAGTYDNSGYHLRGQTQTNSQGFYIFETIKPGRYLNGSTYRPSHIHFKITPPNFSTLTTQLYFQGDPYISSDAAASLNSGAFDATDRIIPLTNNSGTLEGTWDIVISGNGVPTGTSNLHIDKGIIYDASPNPYAERIRIRYGIFKEANVSILVYDVAGRLVANLEESRLGPDKYEAFWTPDSALPNGHYFVALKVNALQVHYLKIVYQK